MKNVQIPYELFVSLLRYHLMEDDDCLNEIRQGLEQKLDSLVRHELYAKYKTAPTQEERENAIGISRYMIFPTTVQMVYYVVSCYTENSMLYA